MMNVGIIHHPRASMFLIVWLSLVPFCDPYPFSGGSPHHARGLGSDVRIRNTEQEQQETGNTFIDHSRRPINYDGEYGPTTSASPFQSTQLSLISEMSANNSNLSTPTWLAPSPTQLPPLKSPLPYNISSESVGNVSSTNLSNSVDDRSSEANGVSPLNSQDSFNSIINEENVKLERGQPSSLVSSEESSESLTKTSSHPKLNLKLDRDYAPNEIAEYIWRTGDEKGFAQTVGEMLQDGELESKDNVILFLENVQQSLDKMRLLKRRKGSRPHHPAL